MRELMIPEILGNPQILMDLIRQAEGLESLAVRMVAVIAGASLLYGAAIGKSSSWRQMVASATKAPAIPLGALAITIPLLLAMNTASGGSATLPQALCIVLLPVGSMMLLLAAAAPVLIFFGLTSDYDFFKLLNVLAFAASALFGLLSTHAYLPPDLIRPRIYQVWILAYAATGVQIAWLLRPFLGDPESRFEFLRTRGPRMSFYTAITHSMIKLAFRRPNASTHLRKETGHA